MQRERKLFVLFCLLLILLLSSNLRVVKAQNSTDTDSDLSLDLAQGQKDPDPEQATIVKNEVQGASMVSQSLTGETVTVDLTPTDTVAPEATKESTEDVLHPEQETSEEVKTIIVTPPPTVEVQTEGESSPTPSDIAPLDDNTATPIPGSSPQSDQNSTPSEATPVPSSEATPSSNSSPTETNQTQGSSEPNTTESSPEILPSPEEATSSAVQGAKTGPNIVQSIFGFLLGIFRR